MERGHRVLEVRIHSSFKRWLLRVTYGPQKAPELDAKAKRAAEVFEELLRKSR